MHGEHRDGLRLLRQAHDRQWERVTTEVANRAVEAEYVSHRDERDQAHVRDDGTDAAITKAKSSVSKRT
jgi:hypothetical protein